MIFGMPTVSFLAFLSWPVIYLVIALVLYVIMAKQDARIDDSEFEGHLRPRRLRGRGNRS